MYFKKFPEFLYDFNYGDRIKTSVVKDITRNIRLRRDILSNVTLYDEIDIVDGETPEVIAEKYYGSAEYHWVVMLCNEKFDYRADFPLPESVLIKHIESVYNPTLYSNDWNWEYTSTESQHTLTLYIRITSTEVPFDLFLDVRHSGSSMEYFRGRVNNYFQLFLTLVASFILAISIKFSLLMIVPQSNLSK